MSIKSISFLIIIWGMLLLSGCATLKNMASSLSGSFKIDPKQVESAISGLPLSVQEQERLNAFMRQIPQGPALWTQMWGDAASNRK